MLLLPAGLRLMAPPRRRRRHRTRRDDLAGSRMLSATTSASARRSRPAHDRLTRSNWPAVDRLSRNGRAATLGTGTRLGLPRHLGLLLQPGHEIRPRWHDGTSRRFSDDRPGGLLRASLVGRLARLLRPLCWRTAHLRWLGCRSGWLSWLSRWAHRSLEVRGQWLPRTRKDLTGLRLGSRFWWLGGRRPRPRLWRAGRRSGLRCRPDRGLLTESKRRSQWLRHPLPSSPGLRRFDGCRRRPGFRVLGGGRTQRWGYRLRFRLDRRAHGRCCRLFLTPRCGRGRGLLLRLRRRRGRGR